MALDLQSDQANIISDEVWSTAQNVIWPNFLSKS